MKKLNDDTRFTGSIGDSDGEIERKIRPVEFSEFEGQNTVVENLKIFVKAAKQRGEALDHDYGKNKLCSTKGKGVSNRNIL